MTKYLTGSAIALIATATIAAAQPVPPAPPVPAAPPHVMHHAMPNSDKVMVRGEVQAKVREHFGRMDANKDGAITTAEITELRAKHVGEHAGHGMDHGGPGSMTMHHGPMRDPAAAFDRLDTNKDGSISRDEFAKGREMRIEKRIEKRIVMREGGADAAKSGEKQERRAFRMHRLGAMGGGRMIVMADTDKDGRITLAEAEAMALQHFDQMDADKDGKVTPEERRAARPMIMKMHMKPKAG